MKLNFELLEQVQEFDLKLFDLEQSKKNGPLELGELTTRRQQLQKNLEQEIQKFEKMKADLKDKREQLSDEAENMKKKQDRSAEVRNQKEYQASLREIENARMEMAILEEDMKILQERLQKQEEAVTQVRGTADSAMAEIKGQEDELAEKLAGLEREINGEKSKRDALAKNVPPDILSLYDRVKKRTRGPALLAIQDPYCPNCYMAIPPQKFNEIIRMENVYVCGTCQLLHYYRGASPN